MADYGENPDQGEFWNDRPGQAWITYDAAMQERLSGVLDILFDGLDLSVGMRGLDIGCGAGLSTMRLAQQLGADGAAVGLDISENLLSFARDKASAAQIDNISFIQADAQSYSFEAEDYDLAISRFGVMFFENPVRAFANMRSALKPDGQMHFVCWAGLEENDFFLSPLKLARQLIPGEIPQIGREPGPMAFSDTDYLHSILSEAGFSTVNIDTHQIEISTTDNVQDNARVQMRIGMAARAIKDADPSQELLQQIQHAFEEDGRKRMADGRITYGGTIHRVQAS